jgi:hypothetical protein
MFRKINVLRIASNILGVTSAQCVKERPRKEWSPKINEAGTWPLSKPRRAEEKEYDMKMAATNTKDLCLPSVFFSFALIPVFLCNLEHTADVSRSSDGVQQ